MSADVASVLLAASAQDWAGRLTPVLLFALFVFIFVLRARDSQDPDEDED